MGWTVGPTCWINNQLAFIANCSLDRERKLTQCKVKFWSTTVRYRCQPIRFRSQQFIALTQPTPSDLCRQPAWPARSIWCVQIAVFSVVRLESVKGWKQSEPSVIYKITLATLQIMWYPRSPRPRKRTEAGRVDGNCETRNIEGCYRVHLWIDQRRRNRFDNSQRPRRNVKDGRPTRSNALRSCQ